MRPKIGITARFRGAIQSHSVHRGYVDHVVRAGGLPLIIPHDDEALCEQMLASIDGLLLSGGEDIDPAVRPVAPVAPVAPGAPGVPRQEEYVYQPERDAFEIRLARLALEQEVPTLGICRGCQVLYVATGNSLIPNISDVTGNRVPHRLSLSEPSRHLVHLAEGSKVAAAYWRRSLLVISYHHQGLDYHDRPDARWRATASADDALVEAIERVDHPWMVGVLWHPELSVHGAAGHRADQIIAAFVAAAGAA